MAWIAPHEQMKTNGNGKSPRMGRRNVVGPHADLSALQGHLGRPDQSAYFHDWPCEVGRSGDIASGNTFQGHVSMVWAQIIHRGLLKVFASGILSPVAAH